MNLWPKPTNCHGAALSACSNLIDTIPVELHEYVYIDVNPHYARGAAADVQFFLMGVEERQPDLARKIMRALGGTWDKKVWEDTLDLTQRRDDDMRVFIRMERDTVCRRVATATRQVEKVIPAVEAQPERVVVETVEDVEWDCSPILAPAEVVAQ